MTADEGELVERAQGREIDTELLEPAMHEATAPPFREAVCEEAMQTAEGSAARCLQAGFGGIVECGDVKFRS
jgi:hypothetical protein